MASYIKVGILTSECDVVDASLGTDGLSRVSSEVVVTGVVLNERGSSEKGYNTLVSLANKAVDSTVGIIKERLTSLPFNAVFMMNPLFAECYHAGNRVVRFFYTESGKRKCREWMVFSDIFEASFDDYYKF